MRLYGSICPIYNREVNDDCRRCGRFYSDNATGIECDSSPMDIPNILKENREGGLNMTKEEMNKKITVVSNFIAERRKKSVGRALVTTSEGIIIGIIED